MQHLNQLDTATDREFMLKAIDLAKNAYGQTRPNPMVGSVIVKDAQIIGSGWHHCAGENHAEIEAMQSVAQQDDLAGSTLYVNLEPCCHVGANPPCTDAIIRHKIARVVCSIEDPNPRVAGKGIEKLRAAGIKVSVGVEADAAMRLNEMFLTYHRLKRPFITCKWGMTLDGRIATDIGHSKWITNDESRAFVHSLRSHHDAVMVGIGTVLSDNPSLNVRLPGYTGAQPKRIICDGYLRTPARSNCLRDIEPENCILATTPLAPEERLQYFRDAGHTVLVLDNKNGFVNMRELFTQLYNRKVQAVFCEGGSVINGSLMQSGFCDKLYAFIAPKLIGGKTGRNPISGWGVENMNEAFPLVEPHVQQFDGDLCISGYVFGLFGKTPQYASGFRNHNESYL